MMQKECTFCRNARLSFFVAPVGYVLLAMQIVDEVFIRPFVHLEMRVNAVCALGAEGGFITRT